MAFTVNNSALTIFVSYSHRDEALHDELVKHLKPLEREGAIRPWHDRQITAGREIGTAIDDVLETAEIVLLLISPDFISSDYCWSREMTRSMDRHQSGEARVIPVILRPVDWHTTPFGKLLALPTDGKAVVSWPNHDDGFLDVAKGIRKVISELRNERTDPSQFLKLSVRSCAVTTQYRGAIFEIDIENQNTELRQVTRCALTIPSLGIVLDHSPGPPNLAGGAPWLSRPPFDLPPRRLTRGTLFFSGGPTQGNALLVEPLAATLSIECYMGPRLVREVELYTYDALRAQEATRVAAPHANLLQTPTEARPFTDKKHQTEQFAQKAADSRLKDVSSAARELLTEASKDRQGVIVSLLAMDEVTVQTNGRNFVERGDPRSAARWRSAVEELSRIGLVEDRAGKRQVYFITDEGYKVAELILQH